MNNKCPKCDYKSLKKWDELTNDEKMVMRAKYSDFPIEERKKHRFCLRCGFEEINNNVLA